jgi:DUF1680 family protein
VLRGHAVRANYLSAGAVDVAVDVADAEMLDSLRGQWERTVATRTYVTGGQGSHHQDEAFGVDWELPPDRAYSETCAGIGSIMFSWRLLLAEGGSQYADLIERTLYNVVATGAAEDGRSYFYTNTLHQRVPGVPADPEETSPRASSSLRAPWFEVSCCPPNVARTIASLAGYVATVDEHGLQLHQYAESEIRTTLLTGEQIALAVTTRYPDDGVITITIESDAAESWALGLRVPAWAAGARVAFRPVSGDGYEADASPGEVAVRAAFRRGDVVELTLPVQPRLSLPDARIDAVRGCAVVERGPEVLAVESIDLAALGVDHVDDVVLDVAAGVAERGGQVWATMIRRNLSNGAWPYPSLSDKDSDSERAGREQSAEVPLIPYRHWANRGPSTMRVFLPIH